MPSLFPLCRYELLGTYCLCRPGTYLPLPDHLSPLLQTDPGQTFSLLPYFLTSCAFSPLSSFSILIFLLVELYPKPFLLTVNHPSRHFRKGQKVAVRSTSGSESETSTSNRLVLCQGSPLHQSFAVLNYPSPLPLFPITRWIFSSIVIFWLIAFFVLLFYHLIACSEFQRLEPPFRPSIPRQTIQLSLTILLITRPDKRAFNSSSRPNFKQ